MATVRMTVVETPTFIREASAVLDEVERAQLISFVAANPEAGDLMPGTGGCRKLRWRAAGRGKRGEILLPRLVAGYQPRMSR